MKSLPLKSDIRNLAREKNLKARNGVIHIANLSKLTLVATERILKMTKASTIEERANATKNDPRWDAIVNRDASADAKFYYSVKSTGVYCRPSCAARLARPENVRYHLTCEDAERAGFRPCKRCKPGQPTLIEQNAKKIAKACRLIETSEETPSLKELAAWAGLSTYHFHRTFRAITGLTPKDYAEAHRSNRVRASLERSDTVTDAIYEAGFNSSSRFYDTSNEVLGMTPSKFRAGGADMDIYFAIGECSLGSILVAQSNKGVCSILIGDDPALLVRDVQDRFPKANLIGNELGYEDLVAKVVGLIEKPGVGCDLPLDIRGTAFQRRVWRALQQIPPGSTATYSDMARKIGLPKAVRAVAQACGANALAVAIPCHRVIRNDGSLSGYRWGVERKRALLARETRV
jgi:AraC family transcriptional regulator of adaptative response/methylated-DNA-[protein]-cysteine methyltransferase